MRGCQYGSRPSRQDAEYVIRHGSRHSTPRAGQWTDRVRVGCWRTGAWARCFACLRCRSKCGECVGPGCDGGGGGRSLGSGKDVGGRPLARRTREGSKARGSVVVVAYCGSKSLEVNTLGCGIGLESRQREVAPFPPAGPGPYDGYPQIARRQVEGLSPGNEVKALICSTDYGTRTYGYQ